MWRRSRAHVGLKCVLDGRPERDHCKLAQQLTKSRHRRSQFSVCGSCHKGCASATSKQRPWRDVDRRNGGTRSASRAAGAVPRPTLAMLLDVNVSVAIDADFLALDRVRHLLPILTRA